MGCHFRLARCVIEWGSEDTRIRKGRLIMTTTTTSPYILTHQPGRLLTLAEFAQLPDKPGWKQELTRGKVVLMPTIKDPRHDWIIRNLSDVLSPYVRAHKLGAITYEQVGYNITLPGEEETGWAPDLAFVRAEHAEIVLDAIDRDIYVPLAPDLIVEVVSPSQSRADMAERVQHWLAAGTRLAWVIWRASQTVDLWQPDEPMRTLAAHDTLDGLDIVPGFLMPVADLFIPPFQRT